MGYKILFGDDDPDLQNLVPQLLRKEDIQVRVAADGQEVIDYWRRDFFDCLILDVMMPVLDGLEVCRRIRRISQVPIILLTALGNEEDVVRGLECGADDYIQKPFRQKEFLARLKVVLKRAERTGYRERAPLVFDGITLDPRTRKLRKKDQIIEITPLEYQLLYFLMCNPGQIFKKEELLHRVWGYPINHHPADADLNLIEVAIR
ncbi:MAG: response regulator transcription factor, partial [Anaerolineales bacterium]